MKIKIYKYLIYSVAFFIILAGVFYWYIAIRAEKETIKNVVSVSFKNDSVTVSLNESAKYITDCKIESKTPSEVSLDVYSTTVMNPFAKQVVSLTLPLNNGVQKIFYCDTFILRR